MRRSDALARLLVALFVGAALFIVAMSVGRALA